MSPARPRRGWWVTAVLLLVLAAVACSTEPGPGSAAPVPSGSAGGTAVGSVPPATAPVDRHASGPSAGCEAAAVVAPGTTDERLVSNGVERSYQLIVPPSYDGATPLPVVFGLHSLTVDYRVVPAMSGFGDEVATTPFIGVSPSGLLNAGGLPYWNAAPVADNGDVTYLTELLDHLEATLCVDTGRVFSMGMSNGAQMSSLLACRLPTRLAAIAPIAGVELNEPCTGPPVPVMAFHGAADPIVPYGGGGLSSVTIADQNLYHGALPAGVATPTGVDESMRRWAEHNGCAPDFVEERISPEVRSRTWSGCAAPTVLYIVDHGGHSWPGKPQPAFEATFGPGTTDIDASSLLFAFFFSSSSGATPAD